MTSFTAAQVPLRKQWAHSQRTGGEFVAILKRVNIQVKVRPSGPRNQLLLLQLEMEARVGIVQKTPNPRPKISGLPELRNPTRALGFRAFSRSLADSFADS